MLTQLPNRKIYDWYQRRGILIIIIPYFFKTDKEHLLIAGDTSHYQQQFADNVFAAVNVDYKKSQETCTVNNG
jgi:hypothetical protein